MEYGNKELKINKRTEKVEDHDFMFPNPPASPVTIKAQNIEEAQEKFKKIISNKKELNNE